MIARIQKSMKNKDGGFTLIELLVVMIIIGILAAIAIPVFLNQRKKAVDASIKSDIKSAATQIETDAIDTQTYPTADATYTAATTNAPSKVSQGNTLVYTSKSTGQFCVSGHNSNGTADALTKAFWYVSDGGGLQSGAPGAKPGLCK